MRSVNYWLGATALTLLAVSAAAQTATPPVAAAAVDDTSLDEIVVTAQKRSENLQKVPIVITAVTGAQLANAGVTGLQTLGLLAPGLNQRTSGGLSFQPSIRGVGTSSNVVENPVALYIDGVYLPQQREGSRELPDIEQVAILKGPQGTLFGRNATGGVIQITTRKPSQEFAFIGSAGIDSYATLRGSVFVTGGLADNLAASVSAEYVDQGEGYGTNLTTGHDTFQILHSLSLRGKLLYDAGSRTDITLIGDYLDRRDRTFTFVPAPGTAFIVPLAGPIRSRFDTYSPIDPYSAFKSGGVSLTINHDLDFAKLMSITAYRRGATNYIFDDLPSGTPTFYVGIAKGDGHNESFTQELQLTSPGVGPFTWTVGAFYFHNKNDNLPIFRNFFPAFYGGPVGPPGANASTLTNGIETTESVAPFAQAGYEILPGTKLTIGGRYTYEKRDLVGSAQLNRYNGTVVPIAYAPPSLTIKKPTWRIALDHQFGPDVLGYASYNRGIKSGGFNILSPANPAYLPERLDAYETGFKTELFDRRLRLNAGAFYYDYSNLQVTQFVGLAQSVVNGAKARIYGLDVDFNARLTTALTLGGGFEILHALFTEYRNAVGSIPKPTGGATLIVVDATGNRVPQSQRFVGTLAADYDTPVSFGRLHVNATANYNGDYYFEADNSLRQGSYVLVNASLAWTSTDSRYTVSVWGKNLLDERVLNNATTQGPGYPISYGGQAPVTFGVTGKVSF